MTGRQFYGPVKAVASHPQPLSGSIINYQLPGRMAELGQTGAGFRLLTAFVLALLFLPMMSTRPY